MISDCFEARKSCERPREHSHAGWLALVLSDALRLSLKLCGGQFDSQGFLKPQIDVRRQGCEPILDGGQLWSQVVNEAQQCAVAKSDCLGASDCCQWTQTAH